MQVSAATVTAMVPTGMAIVASASTTEKTIIGTPMKWVAMLRRSRW